MNVFLLAQSLRSKPILAYGFAVLVVALSHWLRALLGSWLDGFSLLLPTTAVVLAAYFGGRGPGITTAIVAGLLAKYFFIEPRGSFALLWPSGEIAIVFYLVLCVVIVSLMHGMFAANRARGESEAKLAAMNALLEQRVNSRTEALEREMSERAKAQAQLRESQKMESIGQLTGGVAHDFNNFLLVIGSCAQFLRRDDLSAQKRDQYLNAIASTVDRATKLISQLLAFSRRQPLDPRSFDVLDRTRDTIAFVQPLLGPQIVTVVEPCMPRLRAYADVAQFDIALINLLVNARDAMDGVGEITIDFSKLELEAAPPSSPPLPHRSMIAIRVRDTGPGVAEHVKAHIFDPFFTTKGPGKGTGLGLSQVFGFAKQSGGNITVDNPSAGGAAFTLHLPCVGESLFELTPANPVVAVTGADRRVLVVEDNEEVARVALELLCELGFRADWAGSGEAALTWLETCPDVDLVFSDIVMPGMSGVELAERIKVDYPAIPILLTSGYSNQFVEWGAIRGAFIRKPYTVAALSEAILELLAAPIPMNA
jgi:signal transduction histidine kinase